tara:strand:- start:92 stop:349 length:258 start_codon:yes stop_codon:yes gene_type:complete
MNNVEFSIYSITRWLSLPHMEEYGRMAIKHFEQVLEGVRPSNLSHKEIRYILDHVKTDLIESSSIVTIGGEAYDSDFRGIGDTFL